jgi:hypothetical protein
MAMIPCKTFTIDWNTTAGLEEGIEGFKKDIAV